METVYSLRRSAKGDVQQILIPDEENLTKWQVFAVGLGEKAKVFIGALWENYDKTQKYQKSLGVNKIGLASPVTNHPWDCLIMSHDVIWMKTVADADPLLH